METPALEYMMDHPRKGYLKQLFHMFDFIKAKQNSLILNP